MKFFDKTPETVYTGNEDSTEELLENNENTTVNLEKVMTMSDIELALGEHVLGLNNTCGCGKSDCNMNAKLDPNYARLRIAVASLQSIKEEQPDSTAHKVLVEQLATVGADSLAAMLLYALARSNNMERIITKLVRELEED